MLVFELWAAGGDGGEACVAVGALTVADIMAALDFAPDAWREGVASGAIDAEAPAVCAQEFCLDLAALAGEHEGLLLEPVQPAQLLVAVEYRMTAVLASTEQPPPQVRVQPVTPPTALPARNIRPFGKRLTRARVQVATPASPLPAEALRATLCVEIVRACGLKSAVQGAHARLGSSAGLLSHALQLGPHAYAALRLFSGSHALQEGMPPLQTAFQVGPLSLPMQSQPLAQQLAADLQPLASCAQAQTGAPEWGFRRMVDLTLDAATCAAFAGEDLCVELWHHCPRSLAVAAALSQGLPSRGPRDAPRHVHLGTATQPLWPLLTRGGGLHCWLPVTARTGAVVGAVQIAVYFTQLAGARCCSRA